MIFKAQNYFRYVLSIRCSLTNTHLFTLFKDAIGLLCQHLHVSKKLASPIVLKIKCYFMETNSIEHAG